MQAAPVFRLCRCLPLLDLQHRKTKETTGEDRFAVFVCGQLPVAEPLDLRRQRQKAPA